MDPLVLVRVCASLDRSLQGGRLVAFHEEEQQRFRLTIEIDGRPRSIVVVVHPVHPWIGRPFLPRVRGGRSFGSLGPTISKRLVGRQLTRIGRPGPGRVVFFEWSGGEILAAELATHGANLVLIDSRGAVAAAARHPRSSADRLALGGAYLPPAVPKDRVIPWEAESETLDRLLAAASLEGEDAFEALRRRVFGVGSVGAELVVREASISGRSVGEVLRERLRSLENGEVDPVIEGPDDPLEKAREGPESNDWIRLYPWNPPWAPAVGRCRIQREGAEATAGLYYESTARAAELASRIDGLKGLLGREISRTWDSASRAEEDVRSFGDPEVPRRWGEALLAGMRTARRAGESVWVPDPYDPEGSEFAVPAPPDLSLAAAAETHFQRSRRARRGVVTAARRASALRERGARLENLAASYDRARSEADATSLEADLRRIGVPVGLARPARALRAARASVAVRLEGVRMLASRDGLEILVGKTARDNDRLTFRLAGPEDFWFHAAGCPGAHVIVRNPSRLARPPAATLEDAASAAAWFSGARDAGRADVHWTRRKHVRRRRGGPPGTVILKRFEVTSVQPAPPLGLNDGT